MTNAPPLVLGSGSPRRRELLEAVGVKFVVKTSDVDEDAIEASMPNATPTTIALALALAKAQAVAASEPGAFVLGADTIVVLNGAVLGKPKNEAHAAAMLTSLSGCSNHVITAIALASPDHAPRQQAVSTEVVMDEIDDALIARYVATGEPMDKAGAYGIQGYAGAFVEGIRGSYSNVVGLPIRETIAMLREAGAIDIWP